MSRTLLLAAGVAVLLMLAGCQNRAPVGEPVTGVDSSELTRTVQAIYQDRLTDLSSKSAASAEIRLASGEPTGTEPFAVLATLVEANPGRPRYQVSYVLAEPGETPSGTLRKSTYMWDSASRSVRWEASTFSGSVGTSWINGTILGLDAVALQAIGEGKRAVPAF